MVVKRSLATAIVVSILALPLSLAATADAVAGEPQSRAGNATTTQAGEYRAQTVSATDALEAEVARVAHYRRTLNAELKSHYLDRVAAAQTLWLKARKKLRKRSARTAAKKRFAAAQKAARVAYDAGRDRVANQAKSDVANAAKNYELTVSLANQTYESEMSVLVSAHSQKETEILLAANQRELAIDSHYSQLIMDTETGSDYSRVAAEWTNALNVAWSDYTAARDANEIEYSLGKWESTLKYRETVGRGASCSHFPKLCDLKQEI